MSRVISVGTADVPYEFGQSELKKLAQIYLSSKGHNPGRLIDVFDNSLIEKRGIVLPIEWFQSEKSFRERSEEYIRSSLSLSMSAVNNCLDEYGGDVRDFDHVFYVSSTGVSAPSIDAILVNELNLDNHIKRTPIWGLGCAGGAAGLSRALEYTKAFPKSAALLIASEICSLAFQGDDFTKSNIVSLALFADGAAAAIVAGKENKLYQCSNIGLLESLSTTYYDSLDVMGWEVLDNGFKAIFSKEIPLIVRREVRANIEELISSHPISLGDIKHYVVHPGGPKVLSEYEGSLGLRAGAFEHSRKVLREHGNMSSPTVLYVLKEFMVASHESEGEYGVISALGPGFSSELILFKTE
jgi:alkylresorcinol/alkylpyrone synthase